MSFVVAVREGAGDTGMTIACLTCLLLGLGGTEPSPVLCALPLLEGWRDVDQVRREHQGQGGTTGPRAPRRLRIGGGFAEGGLGPAGDEPGDAAQVGASDRDRRR